MVQLSAMKRVKGRAPLSVVVAIIGGLALAGISFTEDLRALTEVKDKEKKRTSLPPETRRSTRLAKVVTSTLQAKPVTPPPAKMAFDASRCSVSCVTKGYCVYDRSKKLPYTDQTCPYIDRQDSCKRKGRQDSDYLYWDWHLDNCILRSSALIHYIFCHALL